MSVDPQLEYDVSRLPPRPPLGRPNVAKSVEHPRAKTGSARGRQVSPHRVRDLISLSIQLGYISLDDQLVEHDLMEIFNTSRTSVRAALAQLSETGMIERRPRVGTRVRTIGLTIPLGDISSVGQDVFLKITEDRIVPNFPLASDKLGLDTESIRMVENSFIYQDTVIGIRTAYFSSSIEVKPEEVAAAPLRMDAIFTETFCQQPGGVEAIIGADSADSRDARIMDIPLGTPLLTRAMTYFAEDGSAIEIVFDRFRVDWVHFGGILNV